MITRFRLENFKAHRDTELALRQFTVLVGDNSSGKTSVLEALRLLSKLRDQSFVHREIAGLIRHRAQEMRLSADGSTSNRSWSLAVAFKPRADNDWTMSVEATTALGSLRVEDTLTWPGWHSALDVVATMTGMVGLYRFRADQVAEGGYTYYRAGADETRGSVSNEHSGVRVAEDGALTAVVLAALRLTDDEAFDRIAQAMRRLVPSLRRIRFAPAELLRSSDANSEIRSKLYFDFQGATNVPAHHASQGTLVALALLTVLHGPTRPNLILLDDFDHSLHPRAQMELVQMIRELLALDEFQDTQLIMTTHSPYVLDEVSPSDIIAFALRDDGTIAAKLLSEHPDAPRVNGSLKAGELWTLDAERDWVL